MGHNQFLYPRKEFPFVIKKQALDKNYERVGLTCGEPLKAMESKLVSGMIIWVENSYERV